MSVASEKELKTRNEDLVNAMKVIGEILVNETLKPAQRKERALAILVLYGCQPVKEGA